MHQGIMNGCWIRPDNVGERYVIYLVINIVMEKLIELLNEYHHFNSDLIYYWWDKEYERVYFHSELPEKEKEKLRKAGIYNEEDDWVDEDWIWDEWICSKKFWFIKWLVENDKIDLEKVEKKFYNEICITDYWDKDRAYWKSDLVISVLSISDTPIEDLISYLK